MRELRWDCDAKGCFRKLCPKLGFFDDCFPGRIGMSDIDGVVEVRGRFLFLEWKSTGGVVTTGQRIMFEQITSLSSDKMKVTVIVVYGNPENMVVDAMQVFTGGKARNMEKINIDVLKERIGAWAHRAVSE